MRTIPVDTASAGSFKFISSAPVMEFDDPTAVKKNTAGVPIFELQVLFTSLETATSKPEADLMKIKIAMATAPALQPLTDLVFQSLVARAWSMAGGKSGVSFSAEAVAPAARRNDENK